MYNSFIGFHIKLEHKKITEIFLLESSLKLALCDCILVLHLVFSIYVKDTPCVAVNLIEKCRFQDKFSNYFGLLFKETNKRARIWEICNIVAEPRRFSYLGTLHLQNHTTLPFLTVNALSRHSESRQTHLKQDYRIKYHASLRFLQCSFHRIWNGFDRLFILHTWQINDKAAPPVVVSVRETGMTVGHLGSETHGLLVDGRDAFTSPRLRAQRKARFVRTVWTVWARRSVSQSSGQHFSEVVGAKHLLPALTRGLRNMGKPCAASGRHQVPQTDDSSAQTVRRRLLWQPGSGALTRWHSGHYGLTPELFPDDVNPFLFRNAPGQRLPLGSPDRGAVLGRCLVRDGAGHEADGGGGEERDWRASGLAAVDVFRSRSLAEIVIGSVVGAKTAYPCLRDLKVRFGRVAFVAGQGQLASLQLFHPGYRFVSIHGQTLSRVLSEITSTFIHILLAENPFPKTAFFIAKGAKSVSFLFTLSCLKLARCKLTLTVKISTICCF